MPHDLLIPETPISEWPGWGLAIFWLWVFVLGAAVGSFLNVVIYRLPRGMSLVWPGSRCPDCEHAIRARDNLPIVGWLQLGGRCRDCGASISARYPLIEALAAGLFLGLGLLYLQTGGATLPGVEQAGLPLEWTERRLAALWAYHLALLLILLIAAGIRYDRLSVPRMPLAMATAIAFVLPCVWPWLRPLASGLVDPRFASQEAVVGGLAGALVGWTAGRLRSKVLARSTTSADSPACEPRLTVLVGVVLGWQGVLAIVVLSSLLGAIGALLASWRPAAASIPDEAGVLLAVLIGLAGWGRLPPLLDPDQTYLWVLAGASLAAIALLAAMQRRLLELLPADGGRGALKRSRRRRRRARREG